MAPPATIVVEVDETYCKGCGLCVAFCERDVLEISTVPNRRGICVARVAHADACRGCRRCVLVCPEAGIRIVRP